MKSLFNKSLTAEAQLDFIAWANTVKGYPDGNGTETYAQPSEPIVTETETYWLTPVSHDLQEAAEAIDDRSFSFVSGEVLADGSIVVTDELIQTDNLEPLVDNVKNYQIEVPREALYDAEMEVIETLIGDGNVL